MYLWAKRLTPSDEVCLEIELGAGPGDVTLRIYDLKPQQARRIVIALLDVFPELKQELLKEGRR